MVVLRFLHDVRLHKEPWGCWCHSCCLEVAAPRLTILFMSSCWDFTGERDCMMTFLKLIMTCFQLKSLPLHPLQSHPVAISPLLSISLSFDGCWHSARRGKLTRGQINRPASERPGVSLPGLQDQDVLARQGNAMSHQETTLSSSATGAMSGPCS